MVGASPCGKELGADRITDARIVARTSKGGMVAKHAVLPWSELPAWVG